jgi:hypothetical protein
MDLWEIMKKPNTIDYASTLIALPPEWLELARVVLEVDICRGLGSYMV